MSDKIEFRSWTLAFAATAIAATLCIAYLDRPAAEFFHRALPLSAWMIWIDWCLAPLKFAVPLALLSVLCSLAWSRFRRSPPVWTRTPLLCCWAAVWAALATIVLKFIFGRASPYPVFLRDGIYGFHFFSSDSHWHSFPSGTAMVTTAILTVLWILAPRSRAMGGTIAGLLFATVVVTNYHWIGDVIAGAFLGALIGRLTAGARTAPEQLH